MKPLIIAMAATTCAFLAAADAPAQTYPSKPVRIIVPYVPGGTSDILSRLLSPKLTEVFGQTVIVENRPGANGNIGADLVAKSPPDGHTMLLADLGALSISPSVYKLPFDPVKDFAPVTMVSYSPHLLVVHPSVPAKTVKELVALGKAKAGRLNFGVSGIGGAPHLAGVAFAEQTGVKWTYIPFKGGADAIIGLASGQVDAIFNAQAKLFLGHGKSGTD
jgi:tripartite-type tricarboxylate transporter receptor subunit TctC